MADQVLLYISAAGDLEAEREVLGRVATEVPIDLGWRVVQSPLGNGPVDLEAVAQADVHVLVLGSDIRAPIGLEWLVARQATRPPTAFLKADTLRTPGEQSFVRMVEDVQPWIPYRSTAELQRAVLALLSDHLLDNIVRYVLRPEQVVEIGRWREALGEPAEPVDEATQGAGDSSVLLSRERFTPTGGVLIGKKDS